LPKVFKGDNVVESGFYTCKNHTAGMGAGGTAGNGASRKSAESGEQVSRAKNEAEEILHDAEEASQALMEGARQKIIAELQAARESGHREGLEKGREEVMRATKQGMTELETLLRELEEKQEQILRAYEEDLYKLALDVAEKIIGIELESNAEAFLGIYRNALQELSGAETIRLTVSEYDADFVTANAELLRSMVKDAKEIKIVTREKAPRGTCIIETPQAIVDAGVDTQLSKIDGAFTDSRMAV